MARPTLVTGAAGFAGGHLIDLLSSQAVPTIAWHRPGGATPREVPGVTWEAVDLRDRGAVREAIRRLQPRCVFHCAGAAHVGRSWDKVVDTLEVNVRGTHHLIEALRHEARDARVILTSSGLVYEPSMDPLTEDHPRLPVSPYGLSKLAQEMVGEDLGGAPEVIIARPFNHFGPRQSDAFVTSAFAKRIVEIELGRSQSQIRVGNLEPSRDLCDVRDTVRAYVMLAERGIPGRAYNVCQGIALPVREVLERLLTLATVSVTVVSDPDLYRPNDVPVVLGNRDRITTEIGWQPLIPFEQTIRDLMEYWRARLRQS
jgi:GDP-4-dehydro-6-deoxy-D-mannose reductase